MVSENGAKVFLRKKFKKKGRCVPSLSLRIKLRPYNKTERKLARNY